MKDNLSNLETKKALATEGSKEKGLKEDVAGENTGNGEDTLYTIKALVPQIINQDDRAYKVVEELQAVLKEAKTNREIKNIALTGTYGSGKSSVIKTLQKDAQLEWDILSISLSTLCTEGETCNDSTKGDDTDTTKDQQEEALNRKIEYSILQQLVYREKFNDLPHSRMRRIPHINERDRMHYSVALIGFILSFIVVFEPEWLRVEDMYQCLSHPKLNVLADIFCTGYIVCCLYKLFCYLIKTYGHVRLGSVNMMNTSIEVKEDCSIFNDYLDEILYFFQVTKYDLVIIEDLDRFDTSRIFLKLRELNTLLNDSKVVDRHIVFLYAVRDDIFRDEERTKFFDYLITTIPVIDSSNSRDKLKVSLAEKGFDDGEISDGQLADIAFFITDMRILRNIVNEYIQYRRQLFKKGHNLDAAKLLAMITYKNYYPKDFALLKCREGKVYDCINQKPQFVEIALVHIKEEQDKLQTLKEHKDKDRHLKEEDLIDLFKAQLLLRYQVHIIAIEIEGVSKSIEEILRSQELLTEVNGEKNLYYNYRSLGYSSTSRGQTWIDLVSIDKELRYSERLELIQKEDDTIRYQELNLKIEEENIRSRTLGELLNVYDVRSHQSYIDLRLPPLVDFFIQRGYIDENYHDYISHFYPEMISNSDREFLLNLRLGHPLPYNYRLDKVGNVRRELQEYMLHSDAVLNIDLLDYAVKSDRELFENIMVRVERTSNPPMEFLEQYRVEGKQKAIVFGRYIDVWAKGPCQGLEPLSVILSYRLNRAVSTEEVNYSLCIETKDRLVTKHIDDFLGDYLALFGGGAKVETEAGLTYLLEHPHLDVKLKEDYLSGQQNKITSYSELKVEYLDLAIQLYLIEPTWENILEYYQDMGTLTEVLKSYLIHYTEELKQIGSLSIAEEALYQLLKHMLCSDQLPDDLVLALFSICSNYTIGIDTIEGVSDERLSMIVEIGRIPISAEYMQSLADRPCYSTYLHFHLDALCEGLQQFAISEQERLGFALPIIEKLIDRSDITKILIALDSTYADLAEGGESPLLEDTDMNRQLLSLLQDKGIISSFKEEEPDKLRVYTVRESKG